MKGQKDSPRFRVSHTEAMMLVLRYIRIKVLEQIKAVAGISIYLVLFQTLVLGIPVLDASIITLGMMMVILGLAFFLEGLMLGIMPMASEIGILLPLKAKIPVIFSIAFVLGLVATFAEPALAVLKASGSSVLPWRAPLLHLFLNRYSSHLLFAIAIGTAIALVLSMLRFLKGWSLKPFIYGMMGTLLSLSLFAYLHPNLKHLLSLAWDSGSVATGPVTVPLMLALGIGISHVANQGGGNTEGGFGVVTLASLIPAIIVLIFGVFLSVQVPAPSTDVEFFSRENTKSSLLFDSDAHKLDYAIGKASYAAQLAAFDADSSKLNEYVTAIGRDDLRIKEVFSGKDGFRRWLIHYGTPDLKREFANVLLPDANVADDNAQSVGGMSGIDYFRRNTVNSLRAIVPLSLFMLGVLYLVLRERLAKMDEIILGLLFAVIGMAVFGGGIDLGLAKLGDQIGSNLPVSFTRMENTADQKIIPNFSRDIVITSKSVDGSDHQFFYYQENDKIIAVPFDEKNYDEFQAVYRYLPARGPLFGETPYSMSGLIVVLLFAFVMGYSATFAEPALSALGITVEDVTVGAIKKTMLVQAVAIGVGVGLSLGVTRIIWNIPLFWLLCPLYLLLLVITKLSSEEYVNIGWDSAGVTTGPITVPLVISMGLGIGGQVGVVEGFGIVSLASVCPILSVLGMGLVVSYRRKAMLKGSEPEGIDLATEENIS